MKERPIIFSAPMVLAILAGRKTQTRRIRKSDRCPYGDVGSILWVRETWLEYPWVGPNNAESTEVAYRADGDDAYPKRVGDRWRSPIHMPRRLSRITLEVTDVRVQRVQDITDADSLAEGCEDRLHFMVAWDKIHSPASFVLNQWVWAITFKRLDETAHQQAAAETAAG